MFQAWSYYKKIITSFVDILLQERLKYESD